jgi:hypothetical protein
MSDDLAKTVGWRLSRHAKLALAQRGFTTVEVLLAAALPDVRYTSYNYGDDREVHVRGDVAAVVHAGSMTVITVLWHTREAWEDQEVLVARGRCMAA